MLHAATSSDFSDAVRGTEQGDLGVEGFTEFFTRALYDDIKARAASDPALRLEIEGTAFSLATETEPRVAEAIDGWLRSLR